MTHFLFRICSVTTYCRQLSGAALFIILLAVGAPSVQSCIISMHRYTLVEPSSGDTIRLSAHYYSYDDGNQHSFLIRVRAGTMIHLMGVPDSYDSLQRYRHGYCGKSYDRQELTILFSIAHTSKPSRAQTLRALRFIYQSLEHISPLEYIYPPLHMDSLRFTCWMTGYYADAMFDFASEIQNKAPGKLHQCISINPELGLDHSDSSIKRLRCPVLLLDDSPDTLDNPNSSLLYSELTTASKTFVQYLRTKRDTMPATRLQQASIQSQQGQNNVQLDDGFYVDSFLYGSEESLVNYLKYGMANKRTGPRITTTIKLNREVSQQKLVPDKIGPIRLGDTVLLQNTSERIVCWMPDSVFSSVLKVSPSKQDKQYWFVDPAFDVASEVYTLRLKQTDTVHICMKSPMRGSLAAVLQVSNTDTCTTCSYNWSNGAKGRLCVVEQPATIYVRKYDSLLQSESVDSFVVKRNGLPLTQYVDVRYGYPFLDSTRVVRCLLDDYSYNIQWFNKTEGLYFSLDYGSVSCWAMATRSDQKDTLFSDTLIVSALRVFPCEQENIQRFGDSLSVQCGNTFFWYHDNQYIAGPSTSTIRVQGSGFYTVIQYYISDRQCRSIGESTIFVDLKSAADDDSEPPPPLTLRSRNGVISIPPEFQDAELRLYNLLGSECLYAASGRSESTLQVEALTPGVYFLVIPDHAKCYKLLIERE